MIYCFWTKKARTDWVVIFTCVLLALLVVLFCSAVFLFRHFSLHKYKFYDSIAKPKASLKARALNSRNPDSAFCFYRDNDRKRSRAVYKIEHSFIFSYKVCKIGAQESFRALLIKTSSGLPDDTPNLSNKFSFGYAEPLFRKK